MDERYHPNFLTEPEEKTIRGRRPRLIVTLIIIVALITAGIYVWYRTEILKNLFGNTISIDKEMMTGNQNPDSLVEEIGQLMILPNEKPTIAIVSNLAKLKNQPFFAQAKEGYKLLIFAKARKAILYDPIGKKIVNVSSVNVSKPN